MVKFFFWHFHLGCVNTYFQCNLLEGGVDKEIQLDHSWHIQNTHHFPLIYWKVNMLDLWGLLLFFLTFTILLVFYFFLMKTMNNETYKFG